MNDADFKIRLSEAEDRLRANLDDLDAGWELVKSIRTDTGGGVSSLSLYLALAVVIEDIHKRYNSEVCSIVSRVEPRRYVHGGYYGKN